VLERSLLDLSEAVRSGELPCDAHLRESRERIGRGDVATHAFLALGEDAADAQVETVASRSPGEQGALAGVPIAVKDNICTRSIPTTCASHMLEGWMPPYDATVVTRLYAAGAVVVGKTNLDEFAMGSSTEFSAFGPTRNPYDLQRVPGGSSGGSAAAVAAGLVPAAIGSDTGGSVRQPAAHCGVVGVKPTYGRISRYGLIAYASSLDQIGVIARQVEDAALLLELVAGQDERDSTSLPGSLAGLAASAHADPAGLRVGIISEMLDEGVEADVRAAIADASRALVNIGLAVDEVSLPRVEPALSAYYVIAPAEASSNLSRFDGVRYGQRKDGKNSAEMTTATRSAGFGIEVKRRILLGTYALSAGYYDEYYGRAMRVRTLVIEDFNRAFEHFDVLLAPTSPRTAFGIGELVKDPMELYLTDICTVTANLAGLPAISVPWGVDRSGLPIGLQVLAPHLNESTMITIAAGLERAAPSLPAPTHGVKPAA
jgi:aspartyl-tRNA(Asn)/glutamyl-tRNA(Gln) amidotransferase subunit A